MLRDVAGHRRSAATMPGYHRGRPPRNKGEQYPADPPSVEEIVAVMRTISDRADGHRLRALIVLLWRAGLRISEPLALQESDLDKSAAPYSSGAGRAESVARSGRIVGRGSNSSRGWRSAASSQSARCCVDPRTDRWVLAPEEETPAGTLIPRRLSAHDLGDPSRRRGPPVGPSRPAH
jgi:hypothetical protein